VWWSRRKKERCSLWFKLVHAYSNPIISDQISFPIIYPYNLTRFSTKAFLYFTFIIFDVRNQIKDILNRPAVMMGKNEEIKIKKWLLV